MWSRDLYFFSPFVSVADELIVATRCRSKLRQALLCTVGKSDGERSRVRRTVAFFFFFFFLFYEWLEVEKFRAMRLSQLLLLCCCCCCFGGAARTGHLHARARHRQQLHNDSFAHKPGSGRRRRAVDDECGGNANVFRASFLAPTSQPSFELVEIRSLSNVHVDDAAAAVRPADQTLAYVQSLYCASVHVVEWLVVGWLVY